MNQITTGSIHYTAFRSITQFCFSNRIKNDIRFAQNTALIQITIKKRKPTMKLDYQLLCKREWMDVNKVVIGTTALPTRSLL